MKTSGRATLTVFLLLLGGVGTMVACGTDEESVAEGTDGGSEAAVESGALDASADTADANVATDASDAAIEGGRTIDGGSCGGESVTLASVTPQFAWKDGATPVTISGSGFVATPKVYVRSATGQLTQIEHVAFISPTSLSAIIPAGLLTSGTYEIAVVNANTCAGGLSGVLRVVDQAPPTVLDVAPAAGTTQNDVPVTITGCHFDANATVSVVNATGTVTVMVAPTSNVAGGADARCGGDPLYTMSAKIETKTKALAAGPYLVRVTNPTPNTFGDFSAFVVTNPSGNLAAAEPASTLVSGRRSLALVAGRINDASRFLYAIGGESAGGVAYDTVEVAPLDRFGQLGKWAVQKNKLTVARSGAAAVRYGSWIYVLGGTSSTNGTSGAAPTGAPLASVERAKILDPSTAPKVADPPTLSTAAGTLAKGTWYYRVSAIGSDPDDPTGESSASDEVVANLSANGSVQLTWNALAGATAYRIYRSKTPDAVAGGEVLLAEVTVGVTYTDNGSVVQAANAATYQAPGATGTWQTIGSTIGASAIGRLDAAAVVAKDPGGDPYLYLTGGFGRCTGSVANELLGCIEVAPIQANGALGAFTLATALGTKRMRHGAAVLDATTGPAAFTDGGATAETAFVVVGGGRMATFDGAKNVEYALVGAGGTLGAFASPSASFSSERDGTQFQLANGYGYAFVGGSLGNGANASYTATSDQASVQLGAATVTFPTWSNAGANLGGANKRGRLGVTAESAYFYLVGGTSNDNDALNTVFRILH